jgi:sucrose-6-phosphate hydrolase SacC (GH32 family)
VPTFIYHGLPDGTCIATSEDDLLIRWTKHPANPVIPCPVDNEKWRTGYRGDPGDARYVVFDPCAWLDGDTCYALIGNRIPGREGDCTSLFKSRDLADWEYVGPFYESRREWTDADEDCAVPDFFPLGDRHMLLYCTHLFGTQYYIGRFEGEKFYPETFGRMSWPGGHLGGPRTMLDGKGRRIFHDWIRDTRAPDDPDRERNIQRDRESGWAGVISLPRILSLGPNNSLRIEPAPETEMLRLNHRQLKAARIQADSELVLDGISGRCLELAIELDPVDSGSIPGVAVACAPDGKERTDIVYNPVDSTLSIDLSRSSLDPEIRYLHYRNRRWKRHSLGQVPDARYLTAQTAPLELEAGESLRLRIFLDQSVLEVYANGLQCVSQRIYPVGPDSVGVRLFSKHSASDAKRIEAWDMAPTME